MRVELPGGHWADLKDPDDLVEGDRKAARKALAVPLDDDGNMVINAGMGDMMTDAVLAQVITGWSFEGRPIPSIVPGTLDTLSIAQARALRKAAEPHHELFWGDGGDPTDGSAS